MATCEWAYFCRMAFFDEQKRVNIIGLIDEARGVAIPSTLAYSCVVARLAGNPGENLPITIRVCAPDGKVLASVSGQQEMGKNGHAHMVLELVQLQIPAHGTYAIQIDVAGVPTGVSQFDMLP